MGTSLWTKKEEWIIREIADDRVFLGGTDADREFSVPRGFLPEDVEVGDVFRFIVELDRRDREPFPPGWYEALERLTTGQL